MVLFSATIIAASAQTIDEARQLTDSRQLDEARAMWEALARSMPKDPDVHRGLGEVALRQQRWAEAVGHLERSAALAPDVAQTYVMLGEAYGAQAEEASIFGKPGLASKCRRAFERAVQLDPTNVQAVQSLFAFYLLAPGILGGGEDKALALANDFRAHDPVLGRLLASEVLERRGDIDAAKTAAKEAVELAPTNTVAQIRFGALMIQSGDAEGAFSFFAEHARNDPDNLLWKFQIGRTAAVSGTHLDEGAAALEAYIAAAGPEAEPPVFAAHWRLGHIHAKRGDRDAARAEFNRTLELNPEFRPAQDDLGKLK